MAGLTFYPAGGHGLSAADTFARPDQSGWGAASDGETWATAEGLPTLAIAGDEGTVNTAASADGVMLLGSKTTAPINWLVRMELTDGNGGAVWRYQSAGNFYRCVCETGHIYLQKANGGIITTLTSATIANISGLFVWLRIVSNSTNIAATIWRDGDSEPGSPTLAITDSTYTAAGKFGISAVSYTGASTLFFDSLIVTDNQPSARRRIFTLDDKEPRLWYSGTS